MVIQSEPRVIALTKEQIDGISKKAVISNPSPGQNPEPALGLEEEKTMTNAEMILGDNMIESTRAIEQNVQSGEPIIPSMAAAPAVENPVPEVQPIPEIQAAPNVQASPVQNPEPAQMDKVEEKSLSGNEKDQIIESIKAKLQEMGATKSAMELLFNKSEILERELLTEVEKLKGLTIGTDTVVMDNNPSVAQVQPEVVQNSNQPGEIMPFSNDFNVSGGGNIFDAPQEGMSKVA